MLRDKLEEIDLMSYDEDPVPRAALLPGTPLETEWETPVKFFL